MRVIPALFFQMEDLEITKNNHAKNIFPNLWLTRG